MLDPSPATAVVWWLRAVWAAAALPIAVASIPSLEANAFHRLFLKLCGRGKIVNSASQRLSVPQKFFGHFYIIGVMWTTCLLGAMCVYAQKTAPLNNYGYGPWKSVFLLLMMEIQVLRRLYETIYVFKYSPLARMHVVSYLTGLIYYTAAPLSLCSSYALEVFNILAKLLTEFVSDGKLRMHFTEFNLWGLLTRLEWYMWIGAALYFWGSIHQCRCHAILGSLRDDNEKLNDYVIPCGDWFEYVSSPHYLAEIVIYAGFVIADGFSDVTILLLFGFVVVNLAFVAVQTQRWYLRKFDDYPKNRRAIIPFVY